MKNAIQQIAALETEHLSKLKSIVENAINEEKLIVENLMHPPKEIITKGQKISDKVARFGGSWAFIITFFVVLVIWIIYNSIAYKSLIFDPYPFILMNLILSCIAALQAPIIMMSQNRQEEKDRKRGENDYLINLKAELEIRAIDEKIKLLIEEQIKLLFDSQTKQLHLLNSIEAKLLALEKK